MSNIKPVSDLKNYNELLKSIVVGNPVILTENGKNRYVLLDIEEYEKTQATINLLSKLVEAEEAIKNDNNWLTSKKVRKDLGK